AYFERGLPSIQRKEVTALNMARPDAHHITIRKPETKDALMEWRTTVCVELSKCAGISMAANWIRCAVISSRFAGERLLVARSCARFRSNVSSITMPSTAIDNTPAILEVALLMPEATPARFPPTEFMTVVVRGATLIAIPRPSTRIPGKNDVQ